jgi:hypothetical protein
MVSDVLSHAILDSEDWTVGAKLLAPTLKRKTAASTSQKLKTPKLAKPVSNRKPPPTAVLNFLPKDSGKSGTNYT